MNLTDYEKSLLSGKEGRAKQLTMELMVKCGEALGAEKLVECNCVNVGIVSPWPIERCYGIDYQSPNRRLGTGCGNHGFDI